VTVDGKGFGVAAVLRLTRVSYRNLDYWARTGLVRSSVRQADGKGTRRVYAFEDLVALRVVKRLRDVGVPLQAIRRAVRCLQAHAERPLAALALVADGKKVLVRTADPARMIDATSEGQVVIQIDVAPIRRKLEAGVVELSAPREIALRVRGRTYRAVLTPDLEAGGYGIHVPELPGCLSDANDLREARRMGREAIELSLDASEQFRNRRAAADQR